MREKYILKLQIDSDARKAHQWKQGIYLSNRKRLNATDDTKNTQWSSLKTFTSCNTPTEEVPSIFPDLSFHFWCSLYKDYTLWRNHLHCLQRKLKNYESLFQANPLYRHQQSSNKIIRVKSELSQSYTPDPEPNSVHSDIHSNPRLLVSVITWL